MGRAQLKICFTIRDGVCVRLLFSTIVLAYLC